MMEWKAMVKGEVIHVLLMSRKVISTVLQLPASFFTQTTCGFASSSCSAVSVLVSVAAAGS